MRDRIGRWRAKRRWEKTQVLTKGAAEKGRKKRKLRAMPGTAFKKFKEATNTLLDQLKDLATSGGLAGVLTTAGVATAASVAAVSSGLVDAVADRLPWTEPDAEVEQVEQVETTATSAIDQAMENFDAIATVEAQVAELPQMADLADLREDLQQEVLDIREAAEALDDRVDSVEVEAERTQDELAAIDVAQIEENAASIEVVEQAVVQTSEQQVELASVLDLVSSQATEALNVAVLAREEVAFTEAGLIEAQQNASDAQVALQQSSSEVLDAQVLLTQLQADQTASAEQIAAAQSQVLMAQASANEAQAAANAADMRAAMAEADAAAAQAQLNDTVTTLTDLGQTVAGVDQALTATTETAQQAQAVAAILEAEAVTAEAERVANATAATQAQAQAVQATADAAVAQATGTAAQTTADGVADSVQGPIQVTLASGTPSGFVPLNNGLTWPEVIATYDTVTVTIIGSNGVVGQQFPVSAFAAEVPIFFGANDSRRGEITPAFPNLVATGATGLTNQQYTVTASGLQPAVAVDPLPVTAGPGQPLQIPTGPWQIGDTPATIIEDGTYLVTLVAKYQSGSGNAVFQGIAIDGVRLDDAVQHRDYPLFVPLTYTANFTVQLSAGQTVNQALAHNSNGTTPWTSILVLAERIG